jgi:hypothetical protein
MNVQELNSFLKETNTDVGFQDIYSRSHEFCGMKRSRINVDGSVQISTFPCNKWRECENCYQFRVTEFESRLGHMPFDTVVIVVEDDVARKLLRKRQITADDYFRSPYSDDTVLIAISQKLLDSVKFDNYLQKLELVEGIELNHRVVEAFVNIPTGYRTSGNLGKVEKKEKELEYDLPIDEDDTVVLETVTYLTDHEQDIFPANLFLRAIIETSTQEYQSLSYPEVYEARCNVYGRITKEKLIVLL